MVTFHIITLFPEAFESYLKSSIIGRAIREKKIGVKFYNPRDFTRDKWHRVDQRPYGGGPGMVLQALPYIQAVEKALAHIARSTKHVTRKRKSSMLHVSGSMIYFFDRSGKQFTNADARLLARGAQAKALAGNVGFRKPYIRDVVLICGHYEGVDARVQKVLKAKKISIGPYTLTGGELPAMLVIDAVSRQVKGVLGTFESIEEERVSSSEVYTRPEILVWKGKKHRVPKVLLSGNHAKIDSWKRKR